MRYNMARNVTAIAGLVFFWITAIYGDCPNPTSILPCTCSKEKSDHTIITCKSVTCEDDLTSVMTAAKRGEIFGVILKSVSIRFFPEYLFNGTGIKSLEIANSGIFSLGEHDLAFMGLENSLESLQVTNCTYANNWDWTQLQKLKKLRRLKILSSGLLELTEQFLNISNLPLEDLNFRDNFIPSLPYRAFANFSGLTRLTLDSNEICSIMRSMLPVPAKKLESLGLSFNKIKCLPVNAFSEMPVLKFLYLGGNPIHILEEQTFKPVWSQLSMVLFQESPLACNCQFSWFTKAKKSKMVLISGKCDSPIDLKGKKITALTSKDLQC